MAKSLVQRYGGYFIFAIPKDWDFNYYTIFNLFFIFKIWRKEKNSISLHLKFKQQD